MSLSPEIEPVAYGQLLAEIKARIHGARVRAALAVNRLAVDLRREFPDMTGRTSEPFLHALVSSATL